MIHADLLWGLTALRARWSGYRLRQQYYDGRHRLAFATDEFRSAFGTLFSAFALNLCPTVVDSVADRLQVVGFSAPAAEGGESGESPAAEAIWADSRMDVQAGHVHVEALVKGSAYVIVWPDEGGWPTLYPQTAEEVVVRYDAGRPGRALYALKAWRADDGRYRVTAYYPDRIERYVTRAKADGIPEKPDTLAEIGPGDVPEGEDATPVVANPYGRVPVFHFASNARVGSVGRSELDDVIPVQDGLNKSILDLLVAGEAQGLPQRWATGVESPINPTTGDKERLMMRPGEIFTTGGDAARLGQFEAADLRQLVEVKREFAADVARVSGTPLHTLLLSGDWPSGEALKTAEARLVRKCRDRIASFGPVWAEAMDFALGIAEQVPDAGLRTQWESPETRVSEREQAETAIAKQAAGVPRRQTWREMGYSEEQIEQMEAEYEEERAKSAELAGRAFDRGAAG